MHNRAPPAGRPRPGDPSMLRPDETSAAPSAPAPVVPGLPFTARTLLAPMEGVTAPAFRDLVLARHAPEDLGGAFTEFVRVVDRPVAHKEIKKHLGEARFPIPVGVQLMGRDEPGVEGSARHVADLGVPVCDLNFGCPARGALKGCAGAAALEDPAGLERVVAAAVRGVEGRIPVTAKIRAGFEHARDVEVLARAAESGGAALLTIHCRTRREGYQPEVDWTRSARAVGAVSIPVAGNGSAWVHADIARMREETGCAFVMTGRSALADPWVFSGRSVPRDEAARVLAEYGDTLLALGAPAKAAVGRIKQLLGYWTAGGLVTSEEERTAWLRRTDFAAFLDDVRTLAGAGAGHGVPR